MPRVDKTMAKHLKKKSRTRLNLQVPRDLLDWAKDYAGRNNTTITTVVVGYLRHLREQDIPQI